MQRALLRGQLLRLRCIFASLLCGLSTRIFASPVKATNHMSLMVIDRAEQAAKLEQLSQEFKQVTIHEVESKKAREARVNKFLDTILYRKEFLVTAAARLTGLLTKLEGLSWFYNPDAEALDGMKEIIGLMHDLHKSMTSNFIEANRFFAKHNMKRDEVFTYKNVADDLLELATDLKNRFFVFPQDDEFQSLTEELNSL